MYDLIVILIPLFPLLAVLANGLNVMLGHRYSHDIAHRIGWGSVLLSFLCAIWVFGQTLGHPEPRTVIAYRWFFRCDLAVNLCFLIAIFLVFAHFGTLDYTEVFATAGTLNSTTAFAIAVCLLIGAVGKSAQLPLYTWLPDAMEGPTPVSALIHAATMVTAGVYMVVRNHAIYDLAPNALVLVGVIGGATALFAATIGFVQTDIKRVLAYSTVSQLGFMFLACGVGAYAAAIFHLVTHAFFNALL